ncbi:MAG: PQQ-binding-like beta-propeller repeat protein [Rubripirellula sp.]|nr:PQQ-binding-like beta-propeller repeat protein [Rubripirellula sp.]
MMALLFRVAPCIADDTWWQFLGPQGNGHTTSTKLPLHWTDVDNVAWKTSLHDRGWSSPVISGDQIWLTTATLDGKQLFAVCIDKKDGRIVHDRQIFTVDQPQKISAANTYATPTPVIDGDSVFVHFGTYGTACLNTETGKLLWTRRDLKCDHETNAGPAGSPTLIEDQLVLHVDGRDVQYIIALDKTTGKTVWKTTRSYDYSTVPVNQRKAYSMPGLAPRSGSVQLVSAAAQGIYSYATDGRELWRVRHKGWSVFPRPVSGHGLVFTIVDRDHPELWAIRHDGSGDVTDTHIQWKETRGMPARATPLLIGDLIYLINREGIMTCLQAKSGDVVWKQRMEGAYSATPIFAQDRIYLFNEESKCTVIRPGKEYKVIAENALNNQTLMATPAVDENAFFVRTENYLYKLVNGVQRESKTEPAEEFIGKWDIGRSKGKPVFVMTLKADYTATKSHVPNATGAWKLVDGEARVIWSDGWRDVIRKQGNRYQKIAFRPDTDFGSPPANSESADKQ